MGAVYLGKNISYRLKTRLTIAISLFILGISVFVFFFISNVYYKDAVKPFEFKSKVFSNYLTNHLDFLFAEKETTYKELKNLFHFNNAKYIVILGPDGTVLRAINLEAAEYYLYINTDSQWGLSPKKKIFRTVAPIMDGAVQVGKVYSGFYVGDQLEEFEHKQFILGIICGGIFLIGILFVFISIHLSYKPLANIFNFLLREERNSDERIKYFAKNEFGNLAKKINEVLDDYEKELFNSAALKRRLDNVFIEKIGELNLEINQRRLAEASLRKSEKQFRLLFDHAPIGMVEVSQDKKIITVNDAFCETFGYDAMELTQKPISIISTGNEFFKDDQMFLSLFRAGKSSIDQEKVLKRKDGKNIYAIVKAVAIKRENGETQNVLMQVLDITKIKNAERKLVAALNKAKESDRLKSAFLAQMSHEIRTPLNVILTASQILADEIGQDDEELETIIESVGSAGKRLQRTIDLILNMSSVQSGNYKPQFKKLDIDDLLKTMVSEFRSLCEEKNLSISYKNSASSSLTEADEYTVNQIFQNLIGNAVKYTPNGYVKILLEDEGDDELIVSIKDSGIGISKNYLRNIFKPFSQEDVGQKREFEGNGLGLALVKKYVDLNNAAIAVQSKKNKGTVFSVKFKKFVNNSGEKEESNTLTENRN